jgi:hypothetical protein
MPAVILPVTTGVVVAPPVVRHDPGTVAKRTPVAHAPLGLPMGAVQDPGALRQHVGRVARCLASGRANGCCEQRPSAQRKADEKKCGVGGLG